MKTHILQNRKSYGVLPEHKYGLSKRPPSGIMEESSYTMFAKVKFFKQTHDTDAGILSRPGKHSGFFFSNDKDGDGGYVKFMVWMNEKDYETPVYKDIKLNKEECEKFHLLHATYDKEKGITEFFINGELKSSFKDEDYKGRVSYINEPYFIGCGNPFAPDPNYNNYGDFEYEYVGLIDKVVTKNEIERLQEITIKHERHGLNILDPKEDISKNVVFYFDFENISRYRIWDVSNNSNHLNIHVFELNDKEIEDKVKII